MIVAVFLFCFMTTESVMASRSQSVNVRIESYDKTLANGFVSANTFLEAVQKLGEKSKIDVVINQGNEEQKIYSVNDIKNNTFSKNDGWYGYIIRDGKVMQPSKTLNTTLMNNDEVVLYYGNIETTAILVNLEENISENKIVLKAVSNYVKWSSGNDGVISKKVSAPISGIRVSMNMPDGLQQVAMTDKNGLVSFGTTKAGYYSYIVEGYQKGTTPLLVKLPEKKVLLGIENVSSITRGELSAFIVNNLDVKAGNKSAEFSDIKNHKCAEEIKRAYSAGVISGYEDGTFRPDNKVTVLETAVILSRFFDEVPSENTDINGVPKWAQKSIYTAITKGIIEKTETGYSEYVSVDKLNKMIENIKK